MDEKEISQMVKNAVLDGINRAKHPKYDWLDVKGVCEWLGISRATLYKWRKVGLPYTTIDGMAIYNKEQVNNWMLKH